MIAYLLITHILGFGLLTFFVLRLDRRLLSILTQLSRLERAILSRGRKQESSFPLDQQQEPKPTGSDASGGRI